MVFKVSEESFSLTTLHCTTKLNIGIINTYVVVVVVVGCICICITRFSQVLSNTNHRKMGKE